MITLKFKYMTRIYKVRIFNKETIWFSQVIAQQELHSTLDGLQLSLAGILKHNPDLEGKDPIEIKKEFVKRFKEHIKKMNSEMDIAHYIVKELEEKWGAKCLSIQRKGFRELSYHG